MIFGLLFALGLIGLGHHFLSDGLYLISGIDQSLSTLIPFWPILFLILGFLLSLLLRSSLGALILIVFLKTNSNFQMDTLYFMLIGVHLSSIWPMRRMTRRGNIYSKRVSAAEALLSSFGAGVGLVFLIFFPFSILHQKKTQE